MIDLDRLRRVLVQGALGAGAMALLLPSLAALRYTDTHDWYAARKVSVVEALIAVGFDERAPTEYRLADGLTVTWRREGVDTFPPARESRSLILAVIGDNALLGACAGFVVVFALSALLNLARHTPAGTNRAPARLPRGGSTVRGTRAGPHAGGHDSGGGRCRPGACGIARCGGGRDAPEDGRHRTRSARPGGRCGAA
ncbi:MAG: hypothetical protein OXH75_21410 [Acidobacteria bacterium]|nr:hypothetical protein [Acidobacteriota bacterium]